MSISISHPTGKANFSRVTFGDLTVYFSYETPIAFRLHVDPIVVRENDWGPTTGKHLNEIIHDRTTRIPGAEFEARLDALVERPVLR